MRRPLSIAVCLALLAAAAAAPVPVARAAEDDLRSSSFITPFPQGDVYKVAVIGDDLADGLLYGLLEAFQTEGRLQISQKPLSMNGLMRADNAEKLVDVEQDLRSAPPNVAIIMLGAWDRVSLRTPSGKRAPVGSPEWRKEYAARADRLVKIAKRTGAAVYVVGLPNVRKWDANEDAQMMNEVLRERALGNGQKYIDTYTGFLDEQGGYSAWGPDLTGKIVKLRDGDGIYFTRAGNRKLAHFVERELRRDLKQAQSDRTVPLAGTEDEQQRINPGKAQVRSPDDPSVVTAGGDAGTAGGAKPVVASEAEQPADNGKISLKTINQSGREDVVTLEIVRPAIPASVVALLARKENKDKPAQLGEVIVDRIPGGLNVMSTITPPVTAGGTGTRGPLSPTQSSYYRVLVKGERLAPRNGRADDFVWPRPEPETAAKTAPPVETGATDAPGGEPPPLSATKKRP